ncbi:MAG: ParB/RepB/Spo0J family partition protein [Acidaminococcaceae bacterium]
MVIDDEFAYLDAAELLGEDVATSGEVSVVQVPVQNIEANPYQPRKHFEPDALAELAHSISQYGVLQPLLVAPIANEKYMLIAGERRLRASKLANLSMVPVIISDYTSQQIAEIALIENLQREDLHYLEEADGYERLMDQFNLTQESMASRVGKKQSTIANKLRLLKLSDKVRKVLKEQGLTERHARALLRLTNEEDQIIVVEEITKNGLNVRQTEKYIETYIEEHQDSAKKKKPKRLMIIQDVRIYLNSIKQITKNMEVSGIPVKVEQKLEGDDVVVTLHIKNTKKTK